MVKAVITKGSRQGRTSPLWQYDYGQILQIEGLELPPAYEVHFGNSENGDSTTSIGNADGVVIPDAYLQSGENVYAWLYLHTGESDGETVYHIQIPVKKRAAITDQQPTPVQQDVITQTIAALDAAVEGVPAAIDEALAEAKASGEFDGDDGFSPVITVEDITGGHRVTITDVNGTQTVDVMDGEKGDPGDPGDPGQPGEDGYSPSISVSNITGGHRVTVTNKTGSSSFDVMDGQDGDPGAPGQDGVSPVATVTKSGKVATITITDKTGTTTATVSDGEDGSPGDPTELIDDTAGSGTTNKTWSANKLMSALNDKYTKPSGGIPASDLAAGIVTDVVNVSGTTPSITGVANTRYICGECSTLTIVVPASGCIDVVFESGSTPTVLTVTPPTGVTAVKWANGFDPSSLDSNTRYEVLIDNGEWGMACAWT